MIPFISKPEKVNRDCKHLYMDGDGDLFCTEENIVDILGQVEGGPQIMSCKGCDHECEATRLIPLIKSGGKRDEKFKDKRKSKKKKKSKEKKSEKVTRDDLLMAEEDARDEERASKRKKANKKKFNFKGKK